ncbi:hypothetical protein F7R12_06410 [Pseudomonas tolaasii]|nr:hypothetical protein F7R12_06410 [Pseudomonas tolaasii]
MPTWVRSLICKKSANDKDSHLVVLGGGVTRCCTPVFQANNFPCGSELARESGLSVTNVLTDTPPSRASPLPQGIASESGFGQVREVAAQAEGLAHEHGLGFGHLVDHLQAGVA